MFEEEIVPNYLINGVIKVQIQVRSRANANVVWSGFVQFDVTCGQIKVQSEEYVWFLLYVSFHFFGAL